MGKRNRNENDSEVEETVRPPKEEGLSKRERFASMFMQAYLGRGASPKAAVENSVGAADLLIRKLEE